MPVCNVSGTLILPNGDVALNRCVNFTRRESRAFVQDEAVVLPEAFSAHTDSEGHIEFEALPGNYRAEAVIGVGNVVPFMVSVPFADTADLADIVNVAEPPLPSSPYRLPVGSQGQVISFDSHGRPIAVDPIQAAVTISQAPDNALELNPDGLFVHETIGPDGGLDLTVLFDNQII